MNFSIFSRAITWVNLSLACRWEYGVNNGIYSLLERTKLRPAGI
jgi:hypothetical protein